MGTLGEIAKRLTRTRGETQHLDDRRSVIAKYVLLGILFVPTTLALLPVIVDEMGRWRRNAPTVTIPAGNWGAYVDRTGIHSDCASDDRPSSTCPFQPENKILWNNSLTLEELGDSRLRRPNVPLDLWLGAEIKPTRLNQAGTSGANYFVFNTVPIFQRVWVDGVMEFEGKPSGRSLPIILSLPVKRFHKDYSLNITVQFPEVDVDATQLALNAEFQSGLYSIRRLQDYLKNTSFRNETRPWFYFAANLLLAALFFVLWRSAARKQEYSYMCVYALVQAIYQIRFIEVLEMRLSTELNFMLDTVLVVYEGAFGMFLAFSFARLRKSIFAWGIPIALIVPWLAVAGGLNSQYFQTWIETALLDWLTPMLYLTGAAICLLQAYFVKFVIGRNQEDEEKSTMMHLRARRLALFGIVILTIMFLNTAKVFQDDSIFFQTLFFHFTHFLLTLLLGGIIAREYRDRMRKRAHRLRVIRSEINEMHRSSSEKNKAS